jgi:hypothetical protein
MSQITLRGIDGKLEKEIWKEADKFLESIKSCEQINSDFHAPRR